MKRILLTSIAAFAAMISFAQSPKVMADKIIAVVGDKIVMKSDIDNSIIDMQRQGMEIPPNARCLTLEQAMGIKALVLQAEKDSLPVTDEEIDGEIDTRIRYFISQYGTKEELEKVAGKSIYQIKEDFKEPVREQKLAAAMRDKIVDDIKITPNEVKNYYDKIPPDSLFLYESEVQINQIVLFPKASREAEDYAIQQLNDYKQQVESGKKDFRVLAREHTDDPGSKDNGGEYNITRDEKGLDRTWLNKAFTLKEGQISAPFKTRFGWHIMQLVSRAGDDATVRHILLIPQVTSVEMRESKNRLDSIRSKLIAGVMPFNEAVKYSDDEASKFTAGAISGKDGSTYLTLDQLDKDMIVMMKDLTVGQYSQPTEYTDESGKKGVRIVYLKSKSAPHKENLRDDYDKVAKRALEDKKNDALDAWYIKKIPSYYIMVDKEYGSCEEMKKWTSAANTAATSH